MTTATFRKLTTDERSILDRLLEVDFAGRDQVRTQLAHVTARTLDDDGGLELRTESTVVANVDRTVPAEAWYQDEDGVRVELLLHVVHGKVRELEIYKVDASPIRLRPAAASLRIDPRYDDQGSAAN